MPANGRYGLTRRLKG